MELIVTMAFYFMLGFGLTFILIYDLNVFGPLLPGQEWGSWEGSDLGVV
jgi:hypothetical protein